MFRLPGRSDGLARTDWRLPTPAWCRGSTQENVVSLWSQATAWPVVLGDSGSVVVDAEVTTCSQDLLPRVPISASVVVAWAIPNFVDGGGLDCIDAVGSRTCSDGCRNNGRVARGGIRALARIVDHAVGNGIGAFDIARRNRMGGGVIVLARRDCGSPAPTTSSRFTMAGHAAPSASIVASTRQERRPECHRNRCPIFPPTECLAAAG